MKKKLIAIILSIIMTVGLLPITASAAGWELVIGGIEYMHDELLSDISGPGWSWSASSGTLTLDEYNGTYIRANRSININVSNGTVNTITVPEIYLEDGINVNGDCTMYGLGRLNIEVLNSSYDGISTTGSGKLNLGISGGLCINAGDDCISTSGSLTVYGRGDVVLKSGDDAVNSYDYIFVSGSGNFTVDAGYYGLYSDRGSITFAGNRSININAVQNAVKLWGETSTLSLEGSAAPITLTSGEGYKAILRGDDGTSPIDGPEYWNYVRMNGSPESESVTYDKVALKIAGNQYYYSEIKNNIDIPAEGWSWDASSKVLTLNGYNGGYIWANNNLDICLAEGSDNVISVPADVYEPALHTLGDCSISGGGNLDIESESVGLDGIWAEKGIIDLNTSGNLTVNVRGDGIYAERELTISGSGDITVTSHDYGLISYNNGINITGTGDITVNAGSSGIYSIKNLICSGSGNVTVTARDYGFEMQSGDVNLAGSGTVTVDAGYYGFYNNFGSLIISGACSVNVNAAQNAVKLWGPESSLILEGTGTPISLKAGDGCAAVLRGDDETSPVGGSLDYYGRITGAPDESLVIYDIENYLTIADTDYSSNDLSADIDKTAEEGWSWDAGSKTLTLSGYNGSYIYARIPLDIVAADGTDNRITVPTNVNEAGIHTHGDCSISGGGSIDINVPGTGNQGILAESGSFVFNMSGSLTVNASDDGISVGNNITVSGSGSLKVNSGDYGMYAPNGTFTLSDSVDVSIKSSDVGIYTNKGDMILSGSGNLNVESNFYGIDCLNANVIISGSGSVSIKGKSGAVSIWGGSKSLLLNGTASPVSLKSDSGCAVRRQDDDTSPVGGTNLSYYDNVTGAPDEGKVVYRHGELTLPFTDVKKSDWSF
ncbi:MAG: carbohydrate-binding domain-containing protein, partial [Clostridia bacterium]|nr:carbohydrate-binding domain-containing protein [Clostridia bacterium]